MPLRTDTTFDTRDPYQVLRVAPDATPAEIRKAYLGLAKTNHPNLFATDPVKYRASTIVMQDINCAYDVLSDPVQRQLWDRKHPRAPRAAPRPAGRISTAYDSGMVDTIIRGYNLFVSKLRTEAARQEALRRIRNFQTSRAGSAFIRSLVARHYQKIIDLIRPGRSIKMYDDGLVEIMFLYDGELEIVPSDIFVTYAYLVKSGILTRLRAGSYRPNDDPAAQETAPGFLARLLDRLRPRPRS